MWVPSDFHCPQHLQVPLQLRELDRRPLQVRAWVYRISAFFFQQFCHSNWCQVVWFSPSLAKFVFSRNLPARSDSAQEQVPNRDGDDEMLNIAIAVSLREEAGENIHNGKKWLITNRLIFSWHSADTGWLRRWRRDDVEGGHCHVPGGAVVGDQQNLQHETTKPRTKV